VRGTTQSLELLDRSCADAGATIAAAVPRTSKIIKAE